MDFFSIYECFNVNFSQNNELQSRADLLFYQYWAIDSGHIAVNVTQLINEMYQGSAMPSTGFDSPLKRIGFSTQFWSSAS